MSEHVGQRAILYGVVFSTLLILLRERKSNPQTEYNLRADTNENIMENNTKRRADSDANGKPLEVD